MIKEKRVEIVLSPLSFGSYVLFFHFLSVLNHNAVHIAGLVDTASVKVVSSFAGVR